jgi:hypothetical protein
MIKEIIKGEDKARTELIQWGSSVSQLNLMEQR